jgi:catechol 2,3-dioxygenase-like lactoylglutathione lyase family enzyme
MINRVGNVSLFVSDQDRAKDFYTRILGFELRQDAPLYPGATNRWVAVAPKVQQPKSRCICPMKIGGTIVRPSGNPKQ